MAAACANGSSPRRQRSTRLIHLAALALSLLLPAIDARAQSQRQDNQPQPGWKQGREFGGVRLPAQPRDADAMFSARRAWAWRDGRTRRLTLRGDVRVHIGVFDFAAERAVVWVERMSRDDRRLWQIAVYFDNVRTPLAAANIAQNARRLLVTGVIAGEIELKTASLTNEPAPDTDFLTEAENRFARRLIALARERGVTRPSPTWPGLPTVSQRPREQTDGLEQTFYEPPTEPTPLDPEAPIFGDTGVVTFHAPDRTLITGEEENAVVISGGVVMQYTDLDRDLSLEISAERAVVFMDPGDVAETLRFGAERVRGVYLEGEVRATNGRYTLRGPRVYYDLRTDQAVVLDAVFHTFDPQLGMPVYVRAERIRQESLAQWEAHKASLSNVSFIDPLFSIGATSVTLRRERRAGSGDEAAPEQRETTVVETRGASLRLSGRPVLPLPDYKGRVDQSRLPEIRLDTRNGDPIIRTRWDLYSLLGEEPPEGTRADLLLDGHFDRGPAVGFDAEWNTEAAQGEAFAYYIHDQGEDLLTSGAEIDAPQDNRGMIAAEHRWRLDDEWTLFAEASYISDEAFVDAFFPDQAEERREFTNSLRARWRRENQAFAAEVRGTLNDFTPNEFLLQSRGRQVQRLPEISHFLIGQDLLGGIFSYTAETRAGLLRFAFTEPEARRFGFDTIERASAAFGSTPGQSPADLLRARGFEEDTVGRFDTRHEVSAPLTAGPFNAVPFVTGRATAYSEDFDEFREANDFEDDDSVRVSGSAGLRLHTSIQKINNDVQSELLDLHRLRHIIEPSATVWTAATNVDAETLPVFDERVESAAEGAAWRLGVRNTWQTKRGGPGRRRSVDWLVLDLNYVNAGGGVERDSPIGRFFESRPETSNFGEFASGEASLKLTDAVSLAGTGVYDTDEDELSSGSTGVLLDHGFGFSSFAEVRRLGEPIESTFINAGAAYKFSPRYAVAGRAEYDAEDEGLQSLGVQIRREAAQWRLDVGVDFDDTLNDTQLSLRFRPKGLTDDGVRGAFTRERDYPDLDETGSTSLFGPGR